MADTNFILLSSTNLTDWQPTLTNSNPDATLDYTDTNGAASGYRFFGVVPLPEPSSLDNRAVS